MQSTPAPQITAARSAKRKRAIHVSGNGPEHQTSDTVSEPTERTGSRKGLRRPDLENASSAKSRSIQSDHLAEESFSTASEVLVINSVSKYPMRKLATVVSLHALHDTA